MTAELAGFVGERMKMFRKELGLTQQALAKELNMSRANISKCEAGIRQLQPAEIREICMKYNLNYGFFFADEPMHKPVNLENLKETQVENLNELLKRPLFRRLLENGDFNALCSAVTNSMQVVSEHLLSETMMELIADRAGHRFSEFVYQAFEEQEAQGMQGGMTEEAKAMKQELQEVLDKLDQGYDAAMRSHATSSSPVIVNFAVTSPRSFQQMMTDIDHLEAEAKKRGGKKK